MSLLKNLFGKKEESIKSNEDFWNWFEKNEKQFFDVVKQDKNIEKGFFDKLSPKLNELKEGFFYLTGMLNDDTVELIITADGNLKNIAFVEDLINSAPKIEAWRFTAHKPEMDIQDVNIRMDGFTFGRKNINFYYSEYRDYPDEIDITVAHDDFSEENKTTITNGVYIFLDNYLGELNAVTTIDSLKVIGKAEAQKDLIPIEKLKDFLLWRQKEFIEKYEGTRYNTENDAHACFESELENANVLLAIVDTDLLDWENKASHPWILCITIKYDGENTKGMPDDETYKLLDEIQNKIMDELKDSEGYLNIGRQTANGEREIYFACKDFRKPSKILYQVQRNYADKIEIDYSLYKDKYWQSFNRFVNN